MNFLTDKQIDYKLFLPAVIAHIRKKAQTDDNLTDAEIKAVVQVVFRDTVIQFIKESSQYRTEVPIDVYKGIKRYDIIAPDGYYIGSSIRLRRGSAKLPNENDYILTDNELELLRCCPPKSIDKAWYIEAAVVPLRTANVCTFSEIFLDMYYDVIYAGMMWRLFGMPERQWHQVGLIQVWKREYQKLRNNAKRGGTDSSKPMKLGFKRMSQQIRYCGRR